MNKLLIILSLTLISTTAFAKKEANRVSGPNQHLIGKRVRELKDGTFACDKVGAPGRHQCHVCGLTGAPDGSTHHGTGSGGSYHCIKQ